MYKLTNTDSIIRISDGAMIPNNPTLNAWCEYVDWCKTNSPMPPDSQIVKTVLELDIEKYKRRADAKPLLMAEMAAMNVGRLKDGTWTTTQLVTLMADPEIKSLISHMETLSFELAIGVINGLTNPIVTSDIKAVWVSKLMAKL